MPPTTTYGNGKNPHLHYTVAFRNSKEYLCSNHNSRSLSAQRESFNSSTATRSQWELWISSLPEKYQAFNSNFKVFKKYSGAQIIAIQVSEITQEVPLVGCAPCCFQSCFQFGLLFFQFWSLGVFIKTRGCSVKVISKFDLRSIYCFL